MPIDGLDLSLGPLISTKSCPAVPFTKQSRQAGFGFASKTKRWPQALLGPPVVPLCPFLGEGSHTKIDYRKNIGYCYFTLSTGGPSVQHSKVCTARCSCELVRQAASSACLPASDAAEKVEGSEEAEASEDLATWPQVEGTA